jgi:dTDP-4-amino-4,6-dideoxygalactose transaminase
LKSKGVSTGIHYPIALPNLKAYSYLKHGKNDFPEATRMSAEILSLPMYPELSESQIQFIAREIKAYGLTARSEARGPELSGKGFV